MDKPQLIQEMIDKAQAQIDQLEAQHYQLGIQLAALHTARQTLLAQKRMEEIRQEEPEAFPETNSDPGDESPPF